MIVQTASFEDYDSWLALAAEVEHLFGPMVGDEQFQTALRKLLQENRGLCVREYDGPEGAQLHGAIAFSEEDNRIDWLAVTDGCRGRGIGRLLLEAALDNLDKSHEIAVQTFADGCQDGIPARHLYHNLGFYDKEPAEPTPTGVPTVIMVRPGDLKVIP